MAILATHINGRRVYQARRWSDRPILHGFGTRGVELAQYLPSLAKQGDRLKIPQTRQVHGTQVHLLSANIPQRIIEGDVLVSATPGVVCYVRTADCIPILIYDPFRRIVGAIHAGWRGLAAGIIGETITSLQAWLGCQPNHLEAAIGPGISGTNYEVDKEVIAQLEAGGHRLKGNLKKSGKGRFLVDLSTIAENALVEAGVESLRIYRGTYCTFAHAGEFYSYRREPGNRGRQYSFIMLRA